MIEKLSIYCDGASRGNPGLAAAAFLVKDEKDKTIHQQSFFLGRTTNNVAEYNGVLLALQWLAKESLSENKEIHFYLDSLLVVNQLTGVFKIKNERLRRMTVQIKRIEEKIKKTIFYHHVERKYNKKADELVNKCLDRCSKTRVLKD